MSLFIILGCLVVLFVVEAVLTEVEHWGWATITMLGTLVGLHFLHVWSVTGFFMAHTVEGLVGTAGYVVLGLVWSFIKWFSFLMGFRDTYREEKDKFFAFKNLPTNTELDQKLQEEFLEGIDGNRYSSRYVLDSSGNKTEAQHWFASVQTYKGNKLSLKPKASENKARITSWAIFWPFSLVGTLINDPLRRLWNLIWGAVKGLYQKMADRLLAGHPELK